MHISDGLAKWIMVHPHSHALTAIKKQAGALPEKSEASPHGTAVQEKQNAGK